MKNQQLSSHTNYIYHNKVLDKCKKLPNILALEIMIRFEYISPPLLISINNKNNLKEFLHFFDLNEATKEKLVNIRK